MAFYVECDDCGRRVDRFARTSDAAEEYAKRHPDGYVRRVIETPGKRRRAMHSAWLCRACRVARGIKIRASRVPDDGLTHDHGWQLANLLPLTLEQSDLPDWPLDCHIPDGLPLHRLNRERVSRHRDTKARLARLVQSYESVVRPKTDSKLIHFQSYESVLNQF